VLEQEAHRRDVIVERRTPVDTTGAGIYVTDPGARMDRDALTGVIREIVQELPPRQRETLDLVDLQGYEPAAVARMTSRNRATVRATLFKARANVRRSLLARAPGIAGVLFVGVGALGMNALINQSRGMLRFVGPRSMETISIQCLSATDALRVTQAHLPKTGQLD